MTKICVEILPTMSILQEKAKRFMSALEIVDLGLDPYMVSAGQWRKAGIPWVPDYLPDHAMAAAFSATGEQEGVLDTIVIWNLDTFDCSNLNIAELNSSVD